MRLLRGSSLLFPVALAALAWAGDLSEVEKQFQSQYVGKILTFRHTYAGDKLWFAADGQLLDKATNSPWTLSGQLQVTQLTIDENAIEIHGKRIFLFFDPETRKFCDIREARKKQKETANLFGDLEEFDVEKDRAVEIDIALPLHWTDAKAFRSAIETVFLGPSEPITSVVPEFLLVYFGKQNVKLEKLPNTDIPIYEAKQAGVIPPKAIYSPEPEYSEVARRAKYSASLTVMIVVGPDGTVKNIQITEPAGLGLDEQAAQTMSTWKFKPGEKDGKPVAVRVYMDICFDLHLASQSTCPSSP
jgi:TonB family protein